MSGAELRATYDDPFVQHQTDPAAVVRAFTLGRAAVIEIRSHLPQAHGHLLMCLGPPDDLGELAATVVDLVDVPSRISVAAPALDAVPAKWRPDPVKRWHWMLTEQVPAAPEVAVEEVRDPDEVTTLLDTHAPDAHARPGSPHVECWLGIREHRDLVAVGALARHHDRTGHLRAVTVVPSVRGRGLGRDLSAALTRRAFEGGSGVASLGVYTDNAPALAIYRRLDYRVVHTFASGPVTG
jgi:ribosomal protein S18 acetylase RimI-like enzyme